MTGQRHRQRLGEKDRYILAEISGAVEPDPFEDRFKRIRITGRDGNGNRRFDLRPFEIIQLEIETGVALGEIVEIDEDLIEASRQLDLETCWASRLRS